MNSSHWSLLRRVADEETTLLISQLPLQIRAKIQNIPIIFEKFPSAALVADGIESDVMGLFVGDDYPHESADPVSTGVFLFLFNIWEEARAEIPVFRMEVRKTLLHEWGHYLGLDENELDERAL